MNHGVNSMRRDGRVAGLIYLVVVLSGMFCLAYVPSQLGRGIAAAAAHAGLFRAGIAAFLLMQVAFVLLPLALYRLFADVDRRAATLMVVLALTSVPIGLVAVTHRIEALTLLDGAGIRTADAATAFALAIQRYGAGVHIASLFWGLWLLPLGWLVLRSARLPRLLGVLLMLGGAGYVVEVFGSLLPGIAAASWFGYVLLPAAMGEIGTCLWLLAFGASPGRIAVPARAPGTDAFDGMER